MTATERVFRGDSDEVLSMDNEADYGKCFFQLSYKEAIAQRIISDYKILTIAVSDERVDRVIKENRILNLGLSDLDEAEARAVAAGVALKRVEKRGARTRFRSTSASVRRSASRTSRMSLIGWGHEPQTFTSQARRPLANAPTSCANSLGSRGLS